IRREQCGRRRHVPPEVLLEAGDDRPGRRDGELLARDLEDQRPKGVEHRPRVDQLRENRVCVTQELPTLATRYRSSLPGRHVDAHSFKSLSVSTISIT